MSVRRCLTLFILVSCCLADLSVFAFQSDPQQVANVDLEQMPQTQEAFVGPLVLPYAGPKIVINIPARELRLYQQDQLIKTYAIAVGSSGHRTPVGERELTQIVWNPWWFPPKESDWAKDAKDTPPGPNNPLGPVKMKLGDAIMIHGTNKPKSVGSAASHGCMRMHNEDAKELARYLQEQAMAQTDPAIYDQYAANGRRSFYVNLTTPIPVNIVYDLIEVQNGQLRVYQDVYWKVAQKRQQVETVLASHGYNVMDYNLDVLEKTIKEAKNRQDLVFDLNQLRFDFQTQPLQTAEAMRVVPMRTALAY